jgi:hypothetical protein
VTSDPTNPSNLIGGWHQDRWSTGGAHGLVAGYLFDSGRSWRESTLPFSRSTPGGLRYERASDPWVSIGPDGTAYVVSLSASNPFSGPNAVVAATSSDGGRTWGNLRSLAPELRQPVRCILRPDQLPQRHLPHQSNRRLRRPHHTVAGGR